MFPWELLWRHDNPHGSVYPILFSNSIELILISLRSLNPFSSSKLTNSENFTSSLHALSQLVHPVRHMWRITTNVDSAIWILRQLAPFGQCDSSLFAPDKAFVFRKIQRGLQATEQPRNPLSMQGARPCDNYPDTGGHAAGEPEGNGTDRMSTAWLHFRLQPIVSDSSVFPLPSLDSVGNRVRP